ncbi:MAG: 60S ribosomal protein L26, partial [Candidatus Micrarchaeota archaeon]|nr:60S ribosomal protein L26 [Candidatus Micrarchaeota archaeon]
MVYSRQPRKQRKARYDAPLHVRQKHVRAHLDKALRLEK